MKQNMNPAQIEKFIISYFDYMSELNDKIRELKNNIKIDEECLKEVEKLQQEFLNMQYSDFTGKGEYHDIIMLPSEIRQAIEDSKNSSEEEIKELKEKYELAKQKAQTEEEKYENLANTEIQRLRDIKKYKLNIKKNKLSINKYKKQYDNNMSKIQKLDKKLQKLNNDEEKNLTYKK